MITQRRSNHSSYGNSPGGMAAKAANPRMYGVAVKKAMKARPSPKSGLNQKKVAFFQGGRLKTILIPILATASQLDAQTNTCQSAFNPPGFSTTSQFLDASKVDHDRQWDLILNQDQPMVTTSFDIEIPNKKEDVNKIVPLEESGPRGSIDAGAPGGRNNQSATNDLKQRKTEVELFINTLLHTLQCNNCDMDSCKKMSRVLGHFVICLKKRTSLLGGQNPACLGPDGPPAKEQSCTLCAQLLDIVTEHAKQPHPQGGEAKCSVPMCDALRRMGDSSSSMGARRESGAAQGEPARNGSAPSAFMPGVEGLMSG
ncbi:hypothetical protein TCAL_07059 [Tigriopus californicus]|uniref:TAZ-type domain-containing protein n=1 Tax=Tigriopus californicus TaxID=6832 RepID=A0A553PP07_TIGCA|nr:hypothetical protein TCAL_07059 [Tigriopus californicus]|eukprot:TCALIF_07059-PA protein Name:"Protein of unknown function" AED:0.09 eAED:0.09 QI:322/1/1/1/0.72/0.83/12/2476/312